MNLPAEKGAKALRSLIISGLEYQRSGMNEDAFTYNFSSMERFFVSFLVGLGGPKGEKRKAKRTSSHGILRTPDRDVARNVRIADLQTFGWRETLECSRYGRVQAQGFVDHTIQVVGILEILIIDVLRGANVPSYLLTQFENVLRIAGKFIEYVG